MKGVDEGRRVSVVRTSLEAVFAFSHFLAPVLPLASLQVFRKLNSSPISIDNLRDDFYNLKPGTKVSIGEILFQKIEIEEQKITTTATNVSKITTKTALVKQPEEDIHETDFTKVDIRVGEIVKSDYYYYYFVSLIYWIITIFLDYNNNNNDIYN